MAYKVDLLKRKKTCTKQNVLKFILTKIEIDLQNHCITDNEDAWIL
jgi:hypothetical protein